MEQRMVSLITALIWALSMRSDFGISTGVKGETVELSASAGAPVPARSPELANLPHVHLSTNSSGWAQQSADALDELRPFAPCIPAVSIISVGPTTECCYQVQAEKLTCLCSKFERYRSQIPEGFVSIEKITQLPHECNIPVPEGYFCDGIPIPGTKSTRF